MDSLSCTCGYRKTDIFSQQTATEVDKPLRHQSFDILRTSYVSYMYSHVMGRAPSNECSLRQTMESTQDRKISMSPIAITGHPPETSTRGQLRKSLKKLSYFSQCDLNRKVKRIFMVESSFPKYILHRSWYTREKLSVILRKSGSLKI